MKRLEILKVSWSTVARDYRSIFVPKFKPWIDNAINSLIIQNPPAGIVLVAGCGTGDEIVSLADKLRSNTFVGIDLAVGMIKLARQTIAAHHLSHRVELIVGDATSVPEELSPIAAVFSCFTLQQMPNPKEVLSSWTESLVPGGILTVCFWPSDAEDSGPWRRMLDLTVLSSQRTPPMVEWEDNLTESLQSIADILIDTTDCHELVWSSVDTFWEAMTRAGPWHATRLQRGDDHMEKLRVQFMDAYQGQPEGKLEHTPRARLIVLRRRQRVPRCNL